MSSVGGDVADETAMSSLFETATEHFGGVDVVVHTAGIMPLAPIAEMELETFDRIQRVPSEGERPAVLVTFDGTGPEELRALAPRIHQVFWKNHTIAVLVMREPIE